MWVGQSKARLVKLCWSDWLKPVEVVGKHLDSVSVVTAPPAGLSADSRKLLLLGVEV